ncbi:OX-2 membrane glycoprotein-like isoform X1 [Grus americana]|nr:OX-2 membrane glycoprotein-like isoform X1 [Grus americana]
MPEVRRDKQRPGVTRAGRQKQKKVKQIFLSKMTLRALILCLACAGFGKANVVPQAKQRNVTVGHNVTLSCTLTEPQDVLQVTWQKNSGKSHYDNIATYSIAKGLKIHEPYQDRMNFTSLVLNETSITFWDTRMEDSGCYTCLFNVFPLGSFSGRTCLNVFGLNASVHYKISEGHLIAICNAVGLPEPTVTWSNLFNSTPKQETVKHINGMVSITSKLEIYNTQNIASQDLTCRISNANEKIELPVKMKGEEGSSWLWLVIIVVILVVIIVLILIMLRWRKTICRRG